MSNPPEHRVWAEVFLDRIKHNLLRIQQKIGPETRIMPVVKADAYGHGAIPVARVCRDYGATMLGLASAQEAHELRNAGFDEPLLILGEVLPSAVSELVDQRIRPSIQTERMVQEFGMEARATQVQHPVHLAVDTGMSRLGVSPEDALELAQTISDHEWLLLEGISTHLSSAYRSDGTEYTRHQLKTFRNILTELEERNIRPERIHVANSGAVFSYPEACYNMVRPGISIYGALTGELSRSQLDLRPALAWKTRLVHIKQVEAGQPIGYGRSYRVSEDTPVGVLSVGYHDGYSYQLSNNSYVLIRGGKCPVIGRVTMDYVMVDLRPAPGACTGDVVTLIGRDGDQEITVSELAERSNTITYELLCSIGDRVHRIYKSTLPHERN